MTDLHKLVTNYFWPVICGLLIAIVIWLAAPQLLNSSSRSSDKHGLGSDQNDYFRENQPYSYASAVNRAAPSVVNIYTSRTVEVYPVTFRDNPRLHNLLRDIGTLRPETQEQQNLGTGIVVNKDGYILTNEHVISDADKILVALSDGRTTEAKVIGVDMITDLAVLKIDLDNLSAINIGDPNAARVGDVVLAIGNAKNLGPQQTVTQGILSAKGRNLFDMNTYVNVDFLQTDAAVNEGNSGGPLVDALGNMIGINSRTLQSDGSFGLSFAIPADLAMRVFRDILEHGKVIRGWLGVEADHHVLSKSEAEALGTDRALRISDLDPRGPAYRAGLEIGDLIVRIEGQTVQDPGRTSRSVANTVAGEKIEFEILRGKQTQLVSVQVATQPEQSLN